MVEARTRACGDAVRVAFVSDSMPERNGVGAYYADLIGQLEGHGIESRFLCPGGDSAGGLHFPLPGDTTQRVFVPSPREFGRVMKRLDPQVVVVATPGPYGMLGVRWARKGKARLIVGFHTDYAGVTDLYSGRVLRVFSRGYFRCADRLMLRRADHVLANSTPMLEQARRMGARHVSRIGTLLPGPVLDTPRTPPRGHLARVLFAGRLAREKRLDAVLEAAERLPALEFVIAGEGPLKPEVERVAARLANVDYLGWLTRPALVEQLDAADALILPSAFESFGNVALEAMGRCRLAVVTETCGIVNWRRLAEHLVVIGRDDPLERVLAELVQRPASERIALAEGGCRAALELNRQSLAQWLELLAPPG